MPQHEILSLLTVFRKGDLGSRSSLVADQSEWKSLNQGDIQKLYSLPTRKQGVLVMGWRWEKRKGRAKLEGPIGQK